MLNCNRCGKKLPQFGEICPYCKKSRTDDFEFLAISFGTALASSICFYFTEDLFYSFACFVFLPSFIKLCDYIFTYKQRKRDKATEEKLENIENRIEELSYLKNKKLISRKEYFTRRWEILNEI